MADGVFASSSCELPFVQRISQDPAIADCAIPATPAPIVDPFDNQIPPAPPSLDVPCPQLDVSAIVVEVPTGTPPSVMTSVERTTSTDECGEGACNLHMNFQFNLPTLTCPEIDATSETIVEDAGSDPSVDVAVVRAEDTCDYSFNFTFRLPQLPDIPCPDLTASAYTNVTHAGSTPSASVVVTPNDEVACGFDFGFTFNLPQLPEIPCPQISANAETTVLPSDGDPSAAVVVTKGDGCDFDFNFTFSLPKAPCPQINATADTTVISSGGTPSASVLVTHTGDDSSCGFNFGFTFNLPAGGGGGGGDGPITCTQLTTTTQLISDGPYYEDALQTITVNSSTDGICQCHSELIVRTPRVGGFWAIITGYSSGAYTWQQIKGDPTEDFDCVQTPVTTVTAPGGYAHNMAEIFVPTGVRVRLFFDSVDGSGHTHYYFIYGHTSFWAVITANSSIGGNRWHYSWNEVVIDGSGNFIDKPFGRSGAYSGDYAINATEASNDGTGVEGNSVDHSGVDFPTGFSMAPVRGEPVVRMWVEADRNCVPIHVFEYTNADDGACST